MTLYNFVCGFVGIVLRILFRIKINGLENIPTDDRRFIVCSNHKSNLDPPLIAYALPIQVAFMAKEELFKFRPFGALISKLGAFPIKRGKSDFAALRNSIEKVKKGKHIMIFPEGGRSHNNRLRKGKMGASMISVKASADILPIGIEGEYKLFRKINVNIGKIIDLSEYAGSKLNSSQLQHITDTIIMPKISELSNVPMTLNSAKNEK